ncbi:MAG: hypothetical protein AB7O66_09390 [Limisphaerales bacterium]
MDAPLPFSENEFRLLEVLLKRKVLSLERILASKIAANRSKDRLTIPVLRDALAATESLKRHPGEK